MATQGDSHSSETDSQEAFFDAQDQDTHGRPQRPLKALLSRPKVAAASSSSLSSPSSSPSSSPIIPHSGTQDTSLVPGSGGGGIVMNGDQKKLFFGDDGRHLHHHHHHTFSRAQPFVHSLDEDPNQMRPKDESEADRRSVSSGQSLIPDGPGCDMMIHVNETAGRHKTPDRHNCGETSSNSQKTSSTLGASYPIAGGIPDVVPPNVSRSEATTDHQYPGSRDCKPPRWKKRASGSPPESLSSHHSCHADVESCSGSVIRDSHDHAGAFALTSSSGLGGCVTPSSSTTCSITLPTTTACAAFPKPESAQYYLPMNSGGDASRKGTQEMKRNKTRSSAHYPCFWLKLCCLSNCSDNMIAFIFIGLFLLLIGNFALYSYIFYLAHLAGHEF